MYNLFPRNGLRPSRYMITDDDTLILSSEVGVLDIDPAKILVKERLRPGKMLLVDTKQGRVIDDDELKESYASRQHRTQHSVVYLSPSIKHQFAFQIIKAFEIVVQ